MGLNIIHSESALAHKYLDGLKGIEIGAAAYQPFGLNTINVNTPDPTDRAHYNAVEDYVAGSIAPIHVYAEADQLPFPSDSYDFVIASHVLEHCRSPIHTLVEFYRVVNDGGYIFLIVPKREAPYGDQNRKITFPGYIQVAYTTNWTYEDAYKGMPDRPAPEFDRWRGHIWVFDLWLLLYIVKWCNNGYIYPLFTNFSIVEAHETDDTDGTGHMLLLKVNK